MTEVVSSVDRDGRDVPHHLALGTYVVIEAESDYARRCLREYAMLPDRSGRYAALYRPIHMIGLELGVSIASAALRKEPTGAPTGFRSDNQRGFAPPPGFRREIGQGQTRGGDETASKRFRSSQCS